MYAYLTVVYKKAYDTSQEGSHLATPLHTKPNTAFK